MNKVIIGGLGVLFVVAFLISGCGKSEEEKVEVPAAGIETATPEAAPAPEQAAPVQEEAAVEVQETMETAAPSAESVMEKAEGMVDEAAEEMKAVGETAVDNAVEQGQDMMQKAADEAAKVVE